MDKIQPLLEVLQPKLIMVIFNGSYLATFEYISAYTRNNTKVVCFPYFFPLFSTQFPEDLRSLCPTITKNKNENNGNLSFLYYSQNVTVCVPKFRDNFEACLAATLAFQLRPRKLALKHKDAALARLNGGRLLLSNGKYLLVPSEAKPVVDLSNKPTRLYWGRVDPARLLSALQKKGINGSLVLPTDDATVSSDIDEIIFSIHLDAQDDVVIKTSATQTVICCADESVAAMICEALSTVCDGI